MGAQWKHAGRLSNSSKRGALISKLVKEITVAAKAGDPNPDNNPRLRAAVEAAKKASVPRDNIDRAIKRGAGLLDDAVQYETISYEGFAPHKVPVIVECLTDNKNRTAADIRVLFRKGQLGAMGSVGWMFDRLGVIEATLDKPGFDSEGAAIEAGAQNVEPLEAEDIPAGHTGARFFTDTQDLNAVAKALTSMGWVVTQAELSFQAKNPVELSAEQKQEVAEFLNAVDEHDDVRRVYVAMG
ncbi:MAG: YebC/PmpR family DNA-binding transcriptional regulator [Oligoflexia bacterium]|nr:YebC/PmpR family DNA-binding transcriptional regulator [Oligoflexia bacterium]